VCGWVGEEEGGRVRQEREKGSGWCFLRLGPVCVCVCVCLTVGMCMCVCVNKCAWRGKEGMLL
jgi:hypothetical protein